MTNKTPRNGKTTNQPIRHTHSTAAALEDAIAVSTELTETLETSLEYARQKSKGILANEIIEALTDALVYASQRVTRITDILKKTRQGPHAYDPEQPSGRRYIIRKR